MARTYSEQMKRIVGQYVESGAPWPASARAIAAWAIREELWKPHPESLIGQCAEQIARAMREEYIQDPQGRTVRAKHAATILQSGKQQTLWADIRTASRQHMEIAFQQRRQQIVGDCRQLNMDVESFNRNRCPNSPIQMVFDFTRDLLELEAAEKLTIANSSSSQPA
jgi:hypothetical protein